MSIKKNKKNSAVRLEMARKSINAIDDRLISLLAARQKVSKAIGDIKREHGLEVFDKKREEQVCTRIAELAKKNHVDAVFAAEIYSAILTNSKKVQNNTSQNKTIKPKLSVSVAPEIGLIGMGRFGKLIAKHLSNGFRIYAYDKSLSSAQIKKLNAIPAGLELVCTKKIIVLAVPISEMQSTLESIKQLVKKDAIIADVCSVKEEPIKLMKKILPSSVQLLGTHPLFGPDSASDSLLGRKIVLCKVRIKNKDYLGIKKILIKLGLDVIEATPAEHDLKMASSLLLAQIIGRLLVNINAKKSNMDTAGFTSLLKLKIIAENDTWQLFYDMNKFNRFSKKIRTELMHALVKIENSLK